MAGITFSDLTSVYDRNYFISYLTPSIIFFIATSLLISTFYPHISIFSSMLNNSSNETNTLSEGVQTPWINDIVILVICSWIISVLLMVLNTKLTRFIEGYGLLRKTRLLKRQQSKFDELHDEIENIEEFLDNYDELNKDKKITKEQINGIISKLKTKYKNLDKLECEEIYETIYDKYTRLSLKSRTEYPPKRSYVLPTSFGNVIRAFELYSYHVYGIDAIAVWTRIFQLAASNHKKSIEDAKSQVDFALNLFYISNFILIEYIAMSLFTWTMPTKWIPFLLIFFVWALYNIAIDSAKAWGEEVKAVFDLYRYNLLEKMGISGITKSSEKEKWEEINQLFLYWNN